MRLLVCGGRKYGVDYQGNEITLLTWPLYDILQEYLDKNPDLTIIQGGARGADYWAKIWALHAGVPHLEFPAEWDKYGRGAGVIRNTRMIVEGRPDLILAFPGGSGTANMVSQGKKYNINTRQVLLDEILRR
jgi:hypothetical protein